MVAITKGVRALAGGAFPLWSAEMPRAAKATIPRTAAAEAKAVYFPSCLSRTMGALPGEPAEMSPVEALVEVATRAGVPVFVPLNAAGTCCGVPFSSKGYGVAHAVAVTRAVERLFRWSDGGRLPVVVDTSPCTYGLLQAREALTDENRMKLDAMTILDAVEFVHDALLPKLAVTRKDPSAVLHPVCSLTKMGLAPKLRAIAEACSEKTVVPLDAGCCGFAGDRGFLVPELTASATRLEAREARIAGAAGHWSSSRTCEVGMTRATGQVYRSFVFLVEKATRAAK